MRRVDEADGQPIGPRPGQFGEADFAARAGAVHHHNGLAEVALHEAGDGAGGQVGAATSREGDDHGDRAVRAPILGARGQGQEGGRGEKAAAVQHGKVPVKKKPAAAGGRAG